MLSLIPDRSQRVSVDIITYKLYYNPVNQEHSVIFYRGRNGKDSVLEEIERFGEKESLKIFKVIELLRHYGLNMSPDRIKHITGKIWELKIDRYRVFYFLYDN